MVELTPMILGLGVGRLPPSTTGASLRGTLPQATYRDAQHKGQQQQGWRWSGHMHGMAMSCMHLTHAT
jgi:hypothetical protein